MTIHIRSRTLAALVLAVVAGSMLATCGSVKATHDASSHDTATHDTSGSNTCIWDTGKWDACTLGP